MPYLADAEKRAWIARDVEDMHVDDHTRGIEPHAKRDRTRINVGKLEALRKTAIRQA